MARKEVRILTNNQSSPQRHRLDFWRKFVPWVITCMALTFAATATRSKNLRATASPQQTPSPKIATPTSQEPEINRAL